MRQNIITPRAGILPDCDRLAEKWVCCIWDCFPSPYQIMHFMSLQKCANLSDCTDWLAHARHASLQPEYSCCYQCLGGEIYLKLKPYLVVKISSDIVTEHCCQVCVLSMMFCRSDCRLCADMVSNCVIRKLLAVPRGLTLRQANMGYEKYSLHLIFTRGQFWPSGIVIACVCVCVRVCVCQSVCQSLACPRDNLGPVQARIAKFGPKMQKTLVKVPIVFGGNWLWPSRSNLTSKSEFTPFWACPDHNSSPIQVRITKFGPEVENSLVKVPIILGGNWPWSSRSNLI